MDQREKVARAICADCTGSDHSWIDYESTASEAIAAMGQEPQPADDEARWIVEQAVRLMAVPGVVALSGRQVTLSNTIDTVRAELLRLRQDAEGER